MFPPTKISQQSVDKKYMNTKIDNAARLSELKEKEYKKLFSVSNTTFDTMFSVFEKRNAEQRIEERRKLKLSILNRLVIMSNIRKRQERAKRNGICANAAL